VTTPGAPALDLDELRRRLAVVRRRIADAGGDPTAITVVAVTKTFGPEVVRLALQAGLRDLGENYAQELVAKAAAGAGAPTPRWQFIGHLQRNKVRHLVPHVHRFQSIDRADLVDELGHRAPGARLLFQVNTTAEAQKAGCAPGDVGALVERARSAGLVVEGLMTVGPTDAAVSARPAFALLRRLVDDHGLDICSMGMTQDLEVAVGEGSSMLRIGRALFGPRHRRTTAAD
jgi:pyridoxal phosphate enzyme (YggS family)